MGSGGSKTRRPTSVETTMITISRIPQEIIDEILGHLITDLAVVSLRSCSLVSKSWVQPCQRHLFRTVAFASNDLDRWLKTFPVPEESPARHVRDLRIWIGGHNRVPEKIFEYTPWFTHMRSLSLLGYWGSSLPQIPSFWRLPHSVTSFTVNTNVVTLVQIRDILAQLPNLNNLSLSGFIAPVDAGLLVGIGAALKGRFGGRLKLCGGYAHEDAMHMLLGTPTGLHFTEVQIRCTHKCLSSAVRLVEACGETLVKLSQTVTVRDDGNVLQRSFDFSNFPNLQEVDFSFRVDWMGGGLPWIPMALSTLKPATSPRLSAIQLNFVWQSSAYQSVDAAIEDVGEDLRRIAGEVARIEREFEGVVSLAVVWDLGFNAALDKLDILQDRSN